MSLAIKDPRQFSNIYPESNALIAQALQDLSSPIASDGQLIQALIADCLREKNDQLLSVAYSLAPSFEVARYIWDNLQYVINQSLPVQLFALPIVVVVGSNEQVSLVSEINLESFTELFTSKEVLLDKASNYISSKLYDLSVISNLKPSTLLSLARGETELESLEASMVAKPIINIDEGVHLRFIIGSVKNVDNGAPLNLANYNNIGLDLLKLLTTNLAKDGVTIFPLPFAPCKLSAAPLIGDYHFKEIMISFRLSNAVKKLRLAGKAPSLKISSQKNNIQIELWLPDMLEAEEIWIWTLQRADDFAEITQLLADLFNDMQLEVAYYPEHDHDD